MYYDNIFVHQLHCYTMPVLFTKTLITITGIHFIFYQPSEVQLSFLKILSHKYFNLLLERKKTALTPGPGQIP